MNISRIDGLLTQYWKDSNFDKLSKRVGVFLNPYQVILYNHLGKPKDVAPDDFVNNGIFKEIVGDSTSSNSFNGYMKILRKKVSNSNKFNTLLTTYMENDNSINKSNLYKELDNHLENMAIAILNRNIPIYFKDLKGIIEDYINDDVFETFSSNEKLEELIINVFITISVSPEETFQDTSIILKNILKRNIGELMNTQQETIKQEMINYNQTQLNNFFPEVYLQEIIQKYFREGYINESNPNEHELFLKNEQVKVFNMVRASIDHVWNMLALDNEEVYIETLKRYGNHRLKQIPESERQISDELMLEKVIEILNTNKKVQHLFNELTNIAENNLDLYFTNSLDSHLMLSLKTLIRESVEVTIKSINESHLQEQNPTVNAEDREDTIMTQNKQKIAEGIVQEVLNSKNYLPNLKESRFAKELFKKTVDAHYGITTIPSETIIIGSIRSDVLTAVFTKSNMKSYYLNAVRYITNELEELDEHDDRVELKRSAEISLYNSVRPKVHLELTSVEDEIITHLHNEVGEDTHITNLDDIVNNIMVIIVNKNTRVNIALEVEDYIEKLNNGTISNSNEVKYNTIIEKFWTDLRNNGYSFYDNEYRETLKPQLVEIISSDKFDSDSKKFLYNFISLKESLIENISRLQLVERDSKLIEFILKHELNNLKKVDVPTFEYISENFKQFKSKINKGELMSIKQENILDNDSLSKRYLLYIKELILEAQKRQLFDEEITSNLPNTQQQLVDLKKGIVRITMSKTNGDKRVMWATLNEQVVATLHKQETLESALQLLESFKQDKSYVKVYDLEKMEQRSYNPDRILEKDEEANLTGWETYSRNSKDWVGLMIDNKSNEAIDSYLTGITNLERVDLEKYLNGQTIDLNKLKLDITNGSSNGEVSEETLDLIKHLGKGRSNPVIAILKEHGIIISPLKSFIEPFSRYLLSNVTVLDGLTVDTLTDEQIFNIITTDEVLNIVKNEAKITKIDVSGEIGQVMNSLTDQAFAEMKKFYGDNHFPYEKEQLINTQQLAQLHLANFHLNYTTQPYKDSVLTEILKTINLVATHPKGKLFNAQIDLSGANEMREMLKKNVGIITFIKSDLTDRTMFVSGNGKFWKHFSYVRDKENFKIELDENGYVAKNEPSEEDLSKPNIKVMDLELINTNNFERQFLYNRLKAVGIQPSHNSPHLPNFIWFDVNNHYWYQLIKSGKSLDTIIAELEQYVDYATGEVKAPTVTDSQLLAEMEQSEKEINELIHQAQLEFIENNPDSELAQRMRNESSDEEEDDGEVNELALYTYRQVQNALKEAVWARYDYDLYKQFLQILEEENVEVGLDTLLPENANKITLASRYDNNLLLVLQADEVTYYISPQFMVNDLGYNVFRDRTETIKFPRRALTLDTDRTHANLLNKFLKLINKRRELSEFEITPINEQSDIERLKRLALLTKKEYMEKYNLTSVNMRYNNVGKHSHLEVIVQDNDKKNVSILISPTSLLNQTSKEIYHQRKANESTLSSLITSINQLSNRNMLPKESLALIARIGQIAFDLRRSF